jgi:hypothetical protein
LQSQGYCSELQTGSCPCAICSSVHVPSHHLSRQIDRHWDLLQG